MAVKKIAETAATSEPEPEAAPAAPAPTITAEALKRVRKGTDQITRTVLKQVNGETLSVIIEGPFVQAPPIVRKGKVVDDPDKKPPMIAEVEDFSTGTKHFLIGNTVLVSELEQAFPDGAYIGKAFDITPNKGAKDYRVYSIAEILF